MPLYQRKGKKRSVSERQVVEAEDVFENNSDSDLELEANQPGSPNIETPERDPDEPDAPVQIKKKKEGQNYIARCC